MNNGITKYEQNIWNKIVNVLKKLFHKNEIYFDKDIQLSETSLSNIKKNNNLEYKNAQKRFVFLVKELEANRMSETDLTLEEIKMLTQYYEKEVIILDKKILEQNAKISRLNYYYEEIH